MRVTDYLSRSISDSYVPSWPKSRLHCASCAPRAKSERVAPTVSFQEYVRMQSAAKFTCLDFNYPVKPPLSELKKMSFPQDKSERRRQKIEALRLLHFPMKNKHLNKLIEEITILKEQHRAKARPDHPSSFRLEIDDSPCEVDIFPIMDATDSSRPPKLRHEIFVSFPLESSEEADGAKHINKSSNKEVRFAWLLGKTPKRLVKTEAYYDCKNGQTKEDREFDIAANKDIAVTESACLKLFNKKTGFPTSYKSAEIDGIKSIVLMDYYPMDMFDILANMYAHYRLDPQQGANDLQKIELALYLLHPIATLHALGIVHRDIKPENYLVDADGNITLCDFGFSCSVKQPEDIRGTCGTFEYMPWERLEMRMQDETICRELSAHEELSADIYAAGIILIRLFFHRLPAYAKLLASEGKTYTLDEVHQHMIEFSKDEPPPSSPLMHLVWEMTHIDPQRRPPAEEVILRLKYIQRSYSAIHPTFSIAESFHGQWSLESQCYTNASTSSTES